MIEIVSLPKGERRIVDPLAVGSRDDLGEHPLAGDPGADGVDAGWRGGGGADERTGGDDGTKIDCGRLLERQRRPPPGPRRLHSRGPVHDPERVALDHGIGGDMDVWRHPHDGVGGGESRRIEPDLPADVGRRRLLREDGPEPGGEITGGEQGRGDDRQRPRRIVGGDSASESLDEGGDLGTAPLEPRFAELAFDERGPDGEPHIVGPHRIRARSRHRRRRGGMRRDKTSEGGVIEPPRHAGKMKPAIVREKQRDPVDSFAALDPTGKFEHDPRDRLLHPGIEDVVEGRSAASWPAVPADTHQSRGIRLGGEPGLDSEERAVTSDRWHEP